MSNYLDNLELFDPRIIAKGRTYYKEKRVHFSSISPSLATAIVYGESHFEVKLQFDPDRDLISATCNCPDVGFCRHMVATLYEVSDYFALGGEQKEEVEDSDKGAALLSSIEDIKNSVFRFNYKGLSKAMEVFISLLPKTGKEGKIKGIRALFESFLSKGKYPIDYDRLTPYVKEILRKAELTNEETVDLFYDILKEYMSSEALWIIMTKDVVSSSPFQLAAAKRIKEGHGAPHHLSNFAPLTSWASVEPVLLDELLGMDAFYLKEEDMATLIKNEAKKNLDATIELFHTAVRNFPGFILDPSVLSSLSSQEEYRKRLEGIFYEEFSLFPTPEKYLLWKGVGTKEDFQNRFYDKIGEIDSPTKDFILSCEGREKTGDIYDTLEVRVIPFSLLGYAVDSVEEEAVIQQFLDYGKEEERDILNDLEEREGDFLTLVRIYGKFGRSDLEKLLAYPLVVDFVDTRPTLRGKVLIEAYKNDLLGILGCKLYRE